MAISSELALEREYFDCHYPKDLEHMIALLGANLSLMAFTKARHPSSIRKWTEHFALVRYKTDFLFCLFFHILIGQSLHFTGQRGSLNLQKESCGPLGEPKLRGILASAHSNVSPFFLLVAATLWLDSESGAGNKLIAYSALFRDRCEHLGIPIENLIAQAIAGAALSFADDYRTLANAAYFKGQTPDNSLLESWSSLLLREFGVTERKLIFGRRKTTRAAVHEQVMAEQKRFANERRRYRPEIKQRRKEMSYTTDDVVITDYGEEGIYISKFWAKRFLRRVKMSWERFVKGSITW